MSLLEYYIPYEPMIVAPQNPHAAMANFSPPLFQLAFAKTATGKQAIETKHIPLSLVDRRVLLLVDGVKTGEELAMFCVGKDASSILQSLLDQELIEIVATAAPPATTSGVPDTAPDTLSALTEPGDLGLPPASQRSASAASSVPSSSPSRLPASPSAAHSASTSRRRSRAVSPSTPSRTA